MGIFESLKVQEFKVQNITDMHNISNIITFIFTFLSMNILQAQVNIGGEPMSYSYEKTGILTPITFEQMPPLDMAIIEAEDIQWEAERAAGVFKTGRRFGIEFEVDYDLHNSGIWTNLPNGGKLWRLGIECFDAFSINLIFDQYRLPKGATLYIYDENKRDKIGGFTEYNNQADYFFATDIILSEKIIIEYYQPCNADFEGELRLATVVHGYRGPGAYSRGLGFGQSGACQRNTICPEGEGWEEQVRSVFLFLSGGTELCTGTMLNNTANDNRPYALTANHCWNLAQNPGIWVFRFHWESPTCSPTANSTYQTMSGAVLRMQKPSHISSSDACLVELNQAIPEDYDVYFSGWSRSNVPSSSGMCIHHPSGDIKKISPSKPLYTVEQLVQGWRADWSTKACTENCSSGSPLFDSNHRVVGQLAGGPSKCNAPQQEMFDVFGRFDLSWEGTDASNRLKDWLDPLNIDPETWDGRNIIMNDVELLDIIIPVEFYNSAAIIEPKVTIKNSGDITINYVTVSYTIDGYNYVLKEWEGTLNPKETVDITFNAQQLTYGTHVFKATVTLKDDQYLSNNSKTKIFEVIIEDGSHVTSIDYDVVNEDKLTYLSVNSEIAITLINVGTESTSGLLTVTLSCDDPQLTIDNANAQYENIIHPDGTISLKFNVTVAHNIPNNKIFPVKVVATDDSQIPWLSIMFIKAFAPELSLENVLINNVEGESLGQGAISLLTLVVVNKGDADAFGVSGIIETNDEYITLACNEFDNTTQNLYAGESINLNYVIFTNPSLPSGYEANLNFFGNAHYDLSFSAQFKVFASEYCMPGSTNCFNSNNFRLVHLCKTSDQSVIIKNTNTSCSLDGYQNYTNIIAALEVGEQYTIKIKTIKGARIKGWFDLNGNLIFETNEQLINFISNSNSQEVSQTFTIPKDAFPGTHRLRLRLQYYGDPEPCNDFTYGQTHDYSFTISEPNPRVQNVVAVLNGQNISVTWEAPDTGIPIGYNIYRKDKCLNSTPLTNLTFTEENIPEGVFVYYVTAVYAGNTESYPVASNFVCNGYKPPQLCEKPVSPVVFSQEKNVLFSWNKPKYLDGFLLGYNVYRDGIKISETDYTVTNYYDESLPNGTFNYQVSAKYEHCEESELTSKVFINLGVDVPNFQTDSFNIFPNPTNGAITITNSELRITHVEIFDVYGRKLFSQSVNELAYITMSVKHLLSGIYFVKIFAENKQIVTKRLVIIK